MSFKDGIPVRVEIESFAKEDIGFSAVRHAKEGDAISIKFREDPSKIKPWGTSSMANVAPHVQGSPEKSKQLCAIYTIGKDEGDNNDYTLTERTIFPGVYAPPISNFGECAFIEEAKQKGDTFVYNGDPEQIKEECDKFIDKNAYDAVTKMMKNGAEDCVLSSPAGFVPDLKQRIGRDNTDTLKLNS